MELLSSVRKWLSSVSSQSYDSISEQTPDSLLARARVQEKPEKDPSVMAPIPSQNYIPPTEVRPFSEEVAATVKEQYRKFQQPAEVVKLAHGKNDRQPTQEEFAKLQSLQWDLREGLLE